MEHSTLLWTRALMSTGTRAQAGCVVFESNRCSKTCETVQRGHPVAHRRVSRRVAQSGSAHRSNIRVDNNCHGNKCEIDLGVPSARRAALTEVEDVARLRTGACGGAAMPMDKTERRARRIPHGCVNRRGRSAACPEGGDGSVRPGEARALLLDLGAAEAALDVVVHHANALHEGVHRGG